MAIDSSPESEKRPHLLGKAPCRRWQLQPAERLQVDEALVERRLPHCESTLERLARRNQPEDVLYRIGKQIRMPRQERPRPVDGCRHRSDMTRVCSSSDVHALVLEHPQAQSTGLADACQHDPGPRGRHQVRVGIRRGDPARPDAYERAARHGAVDRPAPPAGFEECTSPNDSPAPHHGLPDRVGDGGCGTCTRKTCRRGILNRSHEIEAC